jgi:agmatinase
MSPIKEAPPEISAPVAIVGIPFDLNSSFMRGPALAPARIREALHSGAGNLCSENGIDLGEEGLYQDLGDIEFSDDMDWVEVIENRICSLLEADARMLILGGDHAITYPLVKAYSEKFKRLHILHLDAHPDLYDHYEGNRFSHASPFARIMEEGLASRLIQVGIRTLNPHQRRQAQRFDVEIVEMRNFCLDKISAITEPIYLSLDMDVLDPAFAPGVSHHEPGGLSTRQVIEIIQKIKAPLVGADIVEFNPQRDPTEITAMAAAKLFKETLGRMVEQTADSRSCA